LRKKKDETRKKEENENEKDSIESQINQKGKAMWIYTYRILKNK
jgi:hypothetical protein